MAVVFALAVTAIIWLPTSTVSAPAEQEQVATTTPSVEEKVWTFDTLVSHLAKKYGQNESLAREIIRCESTYAPNGLHENTRDDGTVWSRDWGYWQINDYWHLKEATRLGFDIRHDWQDNLEYGFMLLKADGAMAHWSASAYCWNK